jgi:hypothetical protein
MLDDEAFAALRVRVFSSLGLEAFLALGGVDERRAHLAAAFERMAVGQLLDVVELLLEYDSRSSR